LRDDDAIIGKDAKVPVSNISRTTKWTMKIFALVHIKFTSEHGRFLTTGKCIRPIVGAAKYECGERLTERGIKRAAKQDTVSGVSEGITCENAIDDYAITGR